MARLAGGKKVVVCEAVVQVRVRLVKVRARLRVGARARARIRVGVRVRVQVSVRARVRVRVRVRVRECVRLAVPLDPTLLVGLALGDPFLLEAPLAELHEGTWAG